MGSAKIWGQWELKWLKCLNLEPMFNYCKFGMLMSNGCPLYLAIINNLVVYVVFIFVNQVKPIKDKIVKLALAIDIISYSVVKN